MDLSWYQQPHVTILLVYKFREHLQEHIYTNETHYSRHQKKYYKLEVLYITQHIPNPKYVFSLTFLIEIFYYQLVVSLLMFLFILFKEYLNSIHHFPHKRSKSFYYKYFVYSFSYEKEKMILRLTSLK